MPKFSSKHGQREQIFRFFGFEGGYEQDRQSQNLGLNQLSECMNMKYIRHQGGVFLNVRQGTIKISSSALPAAADVLACTYYKNQSKYILATSSKLYYLSSGTPVEIGSLDGIPTFTEFNSKLIIHDSGIMKSWDGTTFTKINKLIQDEVLAAGDGVTTQVTGTLVNLTVKTSSISITFTSSSTSYTITDDGAGNLIGDVDAGGTNTINYTTGVFDFTCSGAPDCDTSVLAEYRQVDGAPKSKAGLVRGRRLYCWGDSDYPSRLTYSEINDETATDSSSGGGYLDIDKNDGQSLLGCLNFFTTVLCLKNRSLHRIDNFPDDATFDAEKLTDDLGTLSHRTPLFEGGIISFVAKEGWMALSPSQRFGDVQKGVPLSATFKNNAVRYANSAAYAAFNPVDNQLWLSLSTDGASTYLDYIYVINLDAKGLTSLYKFAFGHTCFAYANGEMLIGGSDGNLYKLDDTNTIFTDDSVSYETDTYFAGACTDWNLPNNEKLNKRIEIDLIGASSSYTANLDLFKNGSNTKFLTIALSTPTSWPYLFKKRFNYKKIKYKIYDISVSSTVDIQGVKFTSAIIGD